MRIKNRRSEGMFSRVTRAGSPSAPGLHRLEKNPSLQDSTLASRSLSKKLTGVMLRVLPLFLFAREIFNHHYWPIIMIHRFGVWFLITQLVFPRNPFMCYKGGRAWSRELVTNRLGIPLLKCSVTGQTMYLRQNSQSCCRTIWRYPSFVWAPPIWLAEDSRYFDFYI